MRKVIASMNVTLDGFMAGPRGELDWHFPLWSDEMAAYADVQLSNADTILLGRTTYETMMTYWPTMPQNSFTEKMNSHRKVVLSTTREKGDWSNTAFIRQDIQEKILAMKQEKGKDIIIYGSHSVVHTLTTLKLIDEYRLWIHPVIIGNGMPLFREIGLQLNLRLQRSKMFDTGVVILFYEST